MSGRTNRQIADDEQAAYEQLDDGIGLEPRFKGRAVTSRQIQIFSATVDADVQALFVREEFQAAADMGPERLSMTDGAVQSLHNCARQNTSQRKTSQETLLQRGSVIVRR